MGRTFCSFTLKYFELENDLLSTLQHLPKSVRANLAYYRSIVESRCENKFIADASACIEARIIRNLVADCIDNRVPGTFLTGLKCNDGWMSLLGGWRHNGLTSITWKEDIAEYSKLCVGRALMSYFLEYELSIGTRMIVFNGRRFDVPICQTESQSFFMSTVREYLSRSPLDLPISPLNIHRATISDPPSVLPSPIEEAEDRKQVAD